jgi:hypothetical protein
LSGIVIQQTSTRMAAAVVVSPVSIAQRVMALTTPRVLVSAVDVLMNQQRSAEFHTSTAVDTPSDAYTNTLCFTRSLKMLGSAKTNAMSANEMPTRAAAPSHAGAASQSLREMRKTR